MERRFLLFAFLSFLVLYSYQALFVPPAPPSGGAEGQSVQGLGDPSGNATGGTSSTPPETSAQEPVVANRANMHDSVDFNGA